MKHSALIPKSSYNIAKYFDVEDKTTEYINKEVKLSHKVRRGETWSSIARRYGVSVSDVRRWNGNKKHPVLGQNLAIYQNKKIEVDKKEEENKGPFTEETTVNNDAENQMVAKGSSPIPKKIDSKKEVKKAPKPKSVFHTVKKGETVSAISRKYSVNMNDIINLNKLNKRNPIIRVGQSLKIK